MSLVEPLMILYLKGIKAVPTGEGGTREARDGRGATSSRQLPLSLIER